MGYRSGYKWTLVSRLGDMLALAEEKYGKRDQSYTLLGIEFMEGSPQVWFPGNRKSIIIQLDVSCLSDMMRGCYQLAHECIHLLSPTGTRNATVLEEGLATHFSEYYLREKMRRPNWRSSMKSYAQAKKLVEMLLYIEKDAIRILRQDQPVISRITAEDILGRFSKLPSGLAFQLSSSFDREA